MIPVRGKDAVIGSEHTPLWHGLQLAHDWESSKLADWVLHRNGGAGRAGVACVQSVQDVLKHVVMLDGQRGVRLAVLPVGDGLLVARRYTECLARRAGVAMVDLRWLDAEAVSKDAAVHVGRQRVQVASVINDAVSEVRRQQRAELVFGHVVDGQ